MSVQPSGCLQLHPAGARDQSPAEGPRARTLLLEPAPGGLAGDSLQQPCTLEAPSLPYVVRLTCAEAVQLALTCLSGGVALSRGVRSVCSWEG